MRELCKFKRCFPRCCFIVIQSLVMVLLNLVMLLAQASNSVGQAPRHEFRAVWLTTAYGLDFDSIGKQVTGEQPHGIISPDWPLSPPGTTAADSQAHRQELVSIVEQASSLGLNAIIFQVAGHGDAFYQSTLLPWSHLLTGTQGGDPGWDPLQTAIEVAHDHGLEVHAWVNFGVVGYEGLPIATTEPRHVSEARPDWIQARNNVWYLNPGIPSARTWMRDIVLELVQNYDLDGIHMDYIRYPVSGFQDDEQTMERYNANEIEQLDDWRRDNVTDFFRITYDTLKQIKPWVKVGSTPVGHFKRAGFPYPALWGYEDAYQDSRGWLAAGLNDYIAPQLYWSIGEAPDFVALLDDWVQNTYNRHVYIGKAPYKAEVAAEISEQIDRTRASPAAGSVFFRYRHIRPAVSGGSILDERYKAHGALVPPMEWLNMQAPATPDNVYAYWMDDHRLHIRWDHKEYVSDEGDNLVRYAIYRVNSKSGIHHADAIIGEAAHLVGLTGNRAFVDVPDPAEEPYLYVVTALSRNSAESHPSEPLAMQTPTLPEETGSGTFVLEQNAPNPFTSATTIRYELAEQSRVRIEVFDVLGRKVALLADNLHHKGLHEEVIQQVGWSSGIYTYRITARQPLSGRLLFTATRAMTVLKP